MIYIYVPCRAADGSPRNQECTTCKPSSYVHGTVNKTDKNKRSPNENKHVQQVHGSLASQPSPTGIVDFELRDCADGEAVASDGPAVGSLGAVRSATHGGVGDVGCSDIPASGSCCDGGRG